MGEELKKELEDIKTGITTVMMNQTAIMSFVAGVMDNRRLEKQFLECALSTQLQVDKMLGIESPLFKVLKQEAEKEQNKEEKPDLFSELLDELFQRKA